MASSSYHNVRQWVTSRIAAVAPGTRLPSDQELAALFGLSSRTVRRIASALSRDGTVVRIQGAGTFAPKDPAEVAQSAPSTSRRAWEHLANTLRQEILHGEFERSMPLPQVKYLCRRYGVAPSTVSAAYGQLHREGLITRIGRSFWVGSVAHTAHIYAGKRDIFIFQNQGARFKDVFLKDPLMPSYLKMEEVLTESGFRVRYEELSAFDRLLIAWTQNRDVPAGIVFYAFKARPDQPEEYAFFISAQDRIKRLNRMGEAPVRTLFDWERGTYRPAPNSLHLSRPSLIDRCGEVIAECACARAISTVSFFIERVPNLAIDPGMLIWPDFLRFRGEIKNRSGSIATRFFVLSHTNDPLEIPIINEHPRFDTAMLQRRLSRYTLTPFESVEKEFSLVATIEQAFASTENRHALWVFQYDRHAASALEWLRRHRIAVPGRVALLSLDRDPQFLTMGHSRCDIDWDALGILMAHGITNDVPVLRFRNGALLGHARIVEKLTT